MTRSSAKPLMSEADRAWRDWYNTIATAKEQNDFDDWRQWVELAPNWRERLLSFPPRWRRQWDYLTNAIGLLGWDGLTEIGQAQWFYLGFRTGIFAQGGYG